MPGRVKRAAVYVPLAVAVGLFSAVAPVSAELVERSFTATAVASGMYVRYGIPGFLVVENYVDGGGPVSQALVSSDGRAQSYASLPYPGSTTIAAPGLFGVATGGAFVPPGYPFYVYAEHPSQPDQALTDPSGAYALNASAQDRQGAADARVGPPAEKGDAPGAAEPIASAHSEAGSAGGQVMARAVSVAQMISVGGLSLGTVHSESVTTYRQGDAKPTSKTRFTVEGGRAGDTTFSFGPQGLQVAKQDIPVPAGQGLAAINEAVAPAGLSIRFVEPTAIEGGEQSGALEITSVADVPGAGRGTLQVRLGAATSFIAVAGEEPLVEPVIEVPTADSPASSTSGASGDVSGAPPDSLSSANGVTDTTGSQFLGDAETSGGAGDAGLPLTSDGKRRAGEGSTTAVGSAASSSESQPTKTPAQLAAAPGFDGDEAFSTLAGLLVAGMMAGMGLLGVWLWTKRAPAWTS